MTHVILGAIINLLIISPLVLLTLNDKTRKAFNSLIAFCAFYLINTTLLYLPLEFKHLIIIDGKWNWTGKIFAILGSTVFILSSIQKFKPKNYYLTLNQHSGFIQKGILVVVLVVLIPFIKCITSCYFGSSLNGDFETILFQSTMPGLDEEIAFRGIMLGLLIKVLSPLRITILHPAIMVTAILFGLVHGLVINQSLELHFNVIPFLNSFTLGIIWGWLTIKSGSILLSLVSHNLYNVFVFL
jgi:membrane protease YdiL (CAAX protease family)